MALQKNKIYRAELTGYTAEGAAVAHIDGMAVFIPGGAVGDQCDIKIIKIRKIWPLDASSRSLCAPNTALILTARTRASVAGALSTHYL